MISLPVLTQNFIKLEYKFWENFRFPPYVGLMLMSGVKSFVKPLCLRLFHKRVMLYTPLYIRFLHQLFSLDLDRQSTRIRYFVTIAINLDILMTNASNCMVILNGFIRRVALVILLNLRYTIQP